MIPIQLSAIQEFARWALPVLFAITVHEVAHGWVANYLGDKTAKILGRLTLNPIKHIDPLGTILIPGILLLMHTGFIFGWAKPVPINARNLNKPRRDMALIAIAGPLSNITMALIWGGIAKIGTILLSLNVPGAIAIMYMGDAGIKINVMLGILNLFPLPPLDGGHILLGILPANISAKIERISPYGFFILLFLISLGILSAILTPIMSFLYGLIMMLFGL